MHVEQVTPPEEDPTVTKDAITTSSLTGGGKLAPVKLQKPKSNLVDERRISKQDGAVKSRLTWRGLQLAIENESGDVRHPKGPFPTAMPSGISYGFFEGMPSEDGDSIDVIIGPAFDEASIDETVYIASQCDPTTGAFVQHKVMLGFRSAAHAEAMFKLLWPPKMFCGVVSVSAEAFLGGMLNKLDVSKAEKVTKAEDFTADYAASGRPLPELLRAHWEIHRLFDAASRDRTTSMLTVEDIAGVHARIVDELFTMHGVTHPPPPSGMLDQRSYLMETTALHQPEWFVPPWERIAKAEVLLKALSTEEFDYAITFPIAKAEAEKRLVTGIVLEPDEIDAHNDTISSEIIEKAAFSFLAQFNRETEMGHMHRTFGDIGVELCASWIALEDSTIGGQPVKKGSWLMTVRVISNALWQKIKSGAITGFSIGGVASVIPELR